MPKLHGFAMVLLISATLASCSNEYDFQQSIYIHAPQTRVQDLITNVEKSSSLTGSLTQTTDPFSGRSVNVVELHGRDGLMYIAQTSKDVCNNETGQYSGQYFSHVFVVNLSAQRSDELRNLLRIIRNISSEHGYSIYANDGDLCAANKVVK